MAQGSRLGEQGVEALDGAQGAILAGDGHHLWVQVVLELYSLEENGRAKRDVQSGVQIWGSRDPCNRKHTVMKRAENMG